MYKSSIMTPASCPVLEHLAPGSSEDGLSMYLVRDERPEAGSKGKGGSSTSLHMVYMDHGRLHLSPASPTRVSTWEWVPQVPRLLSWAMGGQPRTPRRGGRFLRQCNVHSLQQVRDRVPDKRVGHHVYRGHPMFSPSQRPSTSPKPVCRWDHQSYIILRLCDRRAAALRSVEARDDGPRGATSPGLTSVRSFISSPPSSSATSAESDIVFSL
jgi:hypothetical protein